MPADLIAARVARRHAALVVRTVPTVQKRIEFTATGAIYAFEVARMLDGQLGAIVRLHFRPAPSGPSTTSVPWEAVVEDGGVRTGTLTLHAAVNESEVVSWAVVMIDQAPSR